MGTTNPTLSSPQPSSSFAAAAARSSIVKQKQVFLFEWWLEKAPPTSGGRQLSIGGCTERLGTKIFHSAAVLKRHDTVTLGTADGILVKLCGGINKCQTCENGFPQEFCRHFLYGFPYDWEEFANRCFAEESTDGTIPRGFSNLDGSGVSSVDGLHKFSPKSFDDLPVALLRDFSDPSVEYSATCELWKSLIKDISQKYGGNAKDEVMTENSSVEETPSKQKNSLVEQNNKGENDISIRKGRTANDRMITENASAEKTPSKQKNNMVEQSNKDEDDISTRKGRTTKDQVITENSSEEKTPRRRKKSMIEQNNKGVDDISVRKGETTKDQVITENSSEEETLTKRKKSTVEQKNKGQDDISIRKGKTTKDQVMTENSSNEETPSKHEDNMVELNNKDDMSIGKDRRKNFQNVSLNKGSSSDSSVLRKGPCTRSITHSKNSRNKHEESILVTRKLKLRNRFVEMHVKHIA
ncbi:hypothetical protein ACH5RR_004476 [Cinchona calisaya]|uniref:SANTA domain-containing protein n=1 Tax=Cinchona calisaya TaxID=153742 RepID=A0ABD3AY28_9GENT